MTKGFCWQVRRKYFIVTARTDTVNTGTRLKLSTVRLNEASPRTFITTPAATAAES